MPSVSNVQMAAYQELVAGLARRYTGHHLAEFDDLFQEGQLAVFDALSKGNYPSKNIVAKTMRRWVTRCARQGITGYTKKKGGSNEEGTLLGE